MVGGRMKIHALSTDTGGCHFYRIRTPLTALRKRGHETSWGTGIDADELNRSDVLVAQFLNGAQDLEGWEAIAAAPRRPLLVYECDDDLFTIDEVITSEVTRKKVLWAEPETQARVKRFMELCDLVTVTTPHLAELYRPHAKRVAVLPNAVPDWLLSYPVQPAPEKFTIGWTCSHSHLLDAREHYPHLQKYMYKHPNTMFHWYGPPNAVAFPSWQQKCFRWVGDVNQYLIGMFGQMSVGIAPLGGFEFNKGKSGIKADEYAAWGVPCVASDWPQYRDVVMPGVTGYLAKSPAQWMHYLSELRDPVLRSRMGNAAREAVAERSASKVSHMWEHAYTEALDERHSGHAGAGALSAV